MQELLVVLACVSGKGCVETAGHYRQSNPQIQEMIYYSEQVARKHVPQYVIQYFAPVVAYSAGYDGNIALTRSFGLKVSRRTQSLNYTYSF